MTLLFTVAILVSALLFPGTTEPATLLLSDDFEDGTLNKWPDPINIMNFNAGSGVAHGGSRVARGCWGDYWNVHLRFLNVAHPEVYVRYWINYEAGFSWTRNTNTKHVRLRTAAVQNGFFYTLYVPSGTRVWYTDGNTINDGGSIADGWGSAFTPQTNRWYKYEFYFKLNTGALENGSTWMKVDGVQMLSQSGIKFRTGDSVFYEELVFPNNTGGGGANPGQDCIQIDDVEIWNGLPPTTPSPNAPANLKVK